MEKPVIYLEDIAGMLEEADNDWNQYVNTKTGAFVSVQSEHLSAAENMESENDLERYSEWEREAIQEAVELLPHWEDYKQLPSQYDLHEYEIMRSFADSVTNPHKQELLYVALDGKGAFRKFKDSLIYTQLEDLWYAFRSAALLDLAKDWCEKNQIAYQIKDKTISL